MTVLPAPPATHRPAFRSHWAWIPSLYFSQGIPYVIVMTLSVVMYKRLGVSNTDIALYTSWLYLPWVLKPLWSPLVDITRTKRFWVVAMQFLVSFGLACVAFAIRGSAFFKASLVLFWVMAFASATHDIAADGFYMLSLTKHEQAWWVGLRSTFYRAAMIVGSGLLVVLAGALESNHGLAPVKIPIQAKLGTPAVTFRPPATNSASLPGPLRIQAQPGSLTLPLGVTTADASAALKTAHQWNVEHGFVKESSVGTAGSGNIGCLYLFLSSPPKPDQPVVVNLDREKTTLEYFGLAKGDKGFRLLAGERLVFTHENWNQGAIALIQLDPKLNKEMAVSFLATSGNLHWAWSITLFVVAGLFLAFSCWHSLVLPRPANDGPVVTHGDLAAEFLSTLGSFFEKPGIGMALAFILLYRFDEAQLSKVISPFLLDSRVAGGLGFTTSQVGLAYGTFGILALTCGGLLGGFLAARHGLKKMLPFMVCTMYVPKLVFVCLSIFQPENFLLTCGAIALEQLGYGFGFTAFMLYLLYFADGPHKTAHYAICTGFMALGMMVPGMWSGWLVDHIGYSHFFIWVLCSALPGFTLALLLRIDPQFGKKPA